MSGPELIDGVRGPVLRHASPQQKSLLRSRDGIFGTHKDEITIQRHATGLLRVQVVLTLTPGRPLGQTGSGPGLVLTQGGVATSPTKPCSRSAAVGGLTMINERGAQQRTSDACASTTLSERDKGDVHSFGLAVHGVCLRRPDGPPRSSRRHRLERDPWCRPDEEQPRLRTTVILYPAPRAIPPSDTPGGDRCN